MAVAAKLRQWLFRFGRDEQLPIVLTQRRIFIIPTKTGLLFAVVLVLMLIGAINYNLSLGHALVFLLGGLGMVAMVHTFRNLVALRLMPGRADRVFAGETARFTVHLENDRQQARRALDLSFGNSEAVSTDIPANASSTVAIPCPTQTRGLLDPAASPYRRATRSACSTPGATRTRRSPVWSTPNRSKRRYHRLPWFHSAGKDRATTVRKTSPACASASPTIHHGISPGRRWPATSITARC